MMEWVVEGGPASCAWSGLLTRCICLLVWIMWVKHGLLPLKIVHMLCWRNLIQLYGIYGSISILHRDIIKSHTLHSASILQAHCSCVMVRRSPPWMHAYVPSKKCSKRNRMDLVFYVNLGTSLLCFVAWKYTVNTFLRWWRFIW